MLFGIALCSNVISLLCLLIVWWSSALIFFLFVLFVVNINLNGSFCFPLTIIRHGIVLYSSLIMQQIQYLFRRIFLSL